jgi:chaperonin cofactor prefoldin
MVACMAVMAREAWTDERLDDLKENVNQRFDVVDRRFDEVDKRFEQVDKRFEQVDKRFEQVDKRLASIDTRLDGMQRTMLIGIFSLLASIWASVIGAVLAVLL